MPDEIPKNERLLRELLEERHVTKFERELGELTESKYSAAEQLLQTVDDELDAMRADPAFNELKPEIQEQRLADRRQAMLDQAQQLHADAHIEASKRIEALLAEAEPAPVELTPEQRRLQALEAQERRAQVADEVELLQAEYPGADPRKIENVFAEINAGNPDESEPSEQQLLQLEAAARWGLQALGDRNDESARGLRRRLVDGLRQLRARNDPANAVELFEQRVQEIARKTFGARPRRFESRLARARSGQRVASKFQKKYSSPSERLY